MGGPVDPALRQLWSLGGAPGSAVRALEEAGGALEALAPDLDEAEQLAEATLAPLLAPAVGAGALERALERPGEAVEAEAPAGEVSRDARPGAVPLPRSRPRSEPPPAGTQARAAVRSPRFPELPRAVDAAALERMAAPAAGEKAPPRAERPERIEAPARAERRARRSALEARAALERRAEEAGAGGALHTPVRAGAPGERPAVLAETARTRAPEPSRAPEATDDVKREAARAPGERPRAGVEGGAGVRAAEDSSRAPAGPAPVVRRPGQAPAASGAHAQGRARLLSPTAARAALAHRAERAGAGSALQTPVSTEAAGPERAALLTRAQEPRAAVREPPRPLASPERAAVRPVAPAPERARARPASEAAPAAEAEPRLEGLAGLAARSARKELPPPSLAATAPPRPPIPAVVAERIEEAQLARRLERILRREAEQAGVDLEGLDP